MRREEISPLEATFGKADADLIFKSEEERERRIEKLNNPSHYDDNYTPKSYHLRKSLSKGIITTFLTCSLGFSVWMASKVYDDYVSERQLISYYHKNIYNSIGGLIMGLSIPAGVVVGVTSYRNNTKNDRLLEDVDEPEE